MLSRPIYEMLPYLYLGFGALALWILPVSWGHLFALMLYAMGAVVWIMRSNARRTDRHRSRPRGVSAGHPLFVSFALYELYPFCVTGSALWLMASQPSWAVVAIGAAVVTYGIWLIMLRAEGRGHGWVSLVGWHQGLFR